MTDFDAELSELRADTAAPDAAATRRVAARLSRSIGTLAGDTASAASRPLTWVRPLQLVTSFVLGGAIGAVLYGALRPPVVERVYSERPSASVPAPAAAAGPFTSAVPPPGAPPVTNSAPEVSLGASPTLSSSRSAALPPSASAVGDRLTSLAEQQALLDVARASFARSDYTATVRTLAVHSARFPKSALAEEREALQIKALASSSRMQEARTLATRFRARHPQSLLLPSIHDSVGAIP